MDFHLYFLIVLIVDEALYGIVWYGLLMVEVYNLWSLYMCGLWPLRKIDEYMIVWL